MRILVISQFFPPDITAASFRIGDMGRLLAARGHELTVLTSYPHKARAKGEEGLESRDSSFPARVFRVRTFQVGKGGAKRYLLHYMSFVTGALWQGLRLRLGGWRPNVIWVSSPPLTVGIVARILSVLFRTPYVLEVRDLWPDSAVAAGQLPPSGLAYRLAKRLELHLYRRARRVVCVAQPMRKRIEEQTNTPVVVAYNGVHRDAAVVPAPSASSESNPCEKATRTVLFAGNIGLVQSIDLLVEGFAELQNEGQIPDWRLRILGAGAQVEKVRTLILRYDPAMERMELLPPVSREEAYQATLQADILFLSLRDDPVLRLTIPSKLFDYLLAGKPIVGGIAGEGREILNSTAANVTFEPGNKDDLKRALLEATGRIEELQAKAPANRALVLERFTREMAVDVLEQALFLG